MDHRTIATNDGIANSIDDPALVPTGSKTLDELNALYFVVKEGGKVFVGSFERDRGRDMLVLMSFSDFRNLHMNRKVSTGDKSVQLGKWWLEHPRRRQYSGLIFQPGNSACVIDGRLNLWRGWPFDPKPGDWSKLKEHIRQVLCSSNDELFGYVMNWLAWTVQHPAERAETVLVMRGAKGSGKGTLGKAISKLFGQHALQISSAQHLTGRFNGHLRDCILLFADEAFWPGDIAAEGTLKRIVTEDTLFIEGKYRDAVEVANLLHIIMASNSDWIVPAGERERRFVVFEVNELHLQDHAWFAAINAQLNNGGYAAMLHELLHRNLGKFHPRQLPKCNDLISQQALSLSPLDSWWVELLETGVLPGCDPRQPDRARSSDYDETIFNDRGDVARIVTHPGLYTAARKSVPGLRHLSDHKLGQYLRKRGCANTEKVRRRRGWRFPPLSKCRDDWEKGFPNWPWQDPNLKEWEPPDLSEVPF